MPLGPAEELDVVCNHDAYWDRIAANRDAEVCMVVRRPSGRILTFRKTFYPPGVYRLMTGGIESGEGVLDALMREVAEETGLEVHLSRPLATVRYRGSEGGPARFQTHAFLLQELGGVLGAVDPDEHVEAFREIDPAEMRAIARELEALPDNHSDELEQNWHLWGLFRAVVHRAVADALEA